MSKSVAVVTRQQTTTDLIGELRKHLKEFKDARYEAHLQGKNSSLPFISVKKPRSPYLAISAEEDWKWMETQDIQSATDFKNIETVKFPAEFSMFNFDIIDSIPAFDSREYNEWREQVLNLLQGEIFCLFFIMSCSGLSSLASIYALQDT